MSHMITKNMIAWKNETPWHGLGFKVDSNATGDQMLVTAKMDWKVERRQMAMRHTFNHPDYSKDLLTDPLKKYRAIVRQDTDEVFQIATTRYKPLQNKEIVDFFREYCEAGHASLEVVGGLKGGRIVWALAKVNSGSSIALRGVDKLDGYLLLCTSHDGSLVTTGKATQIRVVCWNTLSWALEEDGHTFKMKHSTKFTDAKKDEARRVMGMAVEQVTKANAEAAALSRVAIDDAGRVRYVRALLGGTLLEEMAADEEKSALDQIVEQEDKEGKQAEETKVGKAILECMMLSPGADLVTAKGTLWGAVNGVTYYVDHVASRTQDSRLANAWFGPTAQLKQQAVVVAKQMAGIQ